MGLPIHECRRAHALLVGIYDRHCAGCCLHVAVDDKNLDAKSVASCALVAAARGHADCVELAELMLRMSETQRRKLAHKGYGGRDGDR